MPLVMGLHIIIIPNLDPEKLGALVWKYKPEHMFGVPTHYQQLAADPLLKNKDLSFIRNYAAGGDSLSLGAEQTVNRFLKAHGVEYPLAKGYGMTEATPLLAYAGSSEYVAGSCGKPVDCATVRIDSDDPRHIVGEIQAKGDNICLGYYKNPEASADAFTEDGFLRTGDLGLFDDDGNLYIKGRSKSMILSANGQNIYPEEVEAVVNSQPYVQESVVVDRASKLVALVYLDQEALRKDGLDQEEVSDLPERIRINSDRQLPNYSQIAKVEIVDQPFEKTPKMSIKRFLYK